MKLEDQFETKDRQDTRLDMVFANLKASIFRAMAIQSVMIVAITVVLVRIFA
jgi:hypothetical protein